VIPAYAGVILCENNLCNPRGEQVGNVDKPTIACEWLHYDAINYAMQQNYLPVVMKLTLTNKSPNDLYQVMVIIRQIFKPKII
jgi:hypothetical protein